MKQRERDEVVAARPRGSMLRRVLCWVPAAGWACLIFHASSVPGDEISLPFWFPGMDKLVHAGVYAVFSTLLFVPLWLVHGWEVGRAAVWAFVLSSLYGVSDEIHQLYVPGRLFEWGDIAANALGSALAFFWGSALKPVERARLLVWHRARGGAWL